MFLTASIVSRGSVDWKQGYTHAHSRMHKEVCIAVEGRRIAREHRSTVLGAWAALHGNDKADFKKAGEAFRKMVFDLDALMPYLTKGKSGGGAQGSSSDEDFARRYEEFMRRRAQIREQLNGVEGVSDE